MTSKFTRAIIIGASSGIGEELAIQLAAQGCKVALVARREAELNHVAERIEARNRSGEPLATIYPHDVTEFGDVSALFQQICRDLGGLDLFIFAAGIMPPMTADEYNFEKDQKIISVNFLGAVAWCNEAARRFAAAGTGTLVGIGSVAGDRGRRTLAPTYCATKAALETYLEALRNRTGRLGVKVVTIKPGPVATPMTKDLGRMPFIITAPEAAKEILRAVEFGANVAYVPSKWRPIMAVVRAIPSAVFQKLNI